MGVMELYSTVAETIYSYTGLSPVAFFTILSLMFGIYHMVCGMFVSPETEAAAEAAAERRPVLPEPVIPLEPVEIGEVTIEELRAYDGSDPKKPLLMAIKGNIYDVSKSSYFEATKSLAATNLTHTFKSMLHNVKQHLTKSTNNYKKGVDVHRRAKVFEIGDLVMLHLRKGRFPPGTYFKLKPHKLGLFPITKQINDISLIFLWISIFCLPSTSLTSTVIIRSIMCLASS